MALNLFVFSEVADQFFSFSGQIAMVDSNEIVTV
jgi:hypothetical protein